MSRNPVDTRIRILETTWKLLGSGDKAVRMSDIAKGAGISRQALYLHFPNRAELLIAVTRHIDSVNDVDAQLAASRAATRGVDRLNAFIAAWGRYIPQIHGISVALRAMQDDPEAAAAWDDRMQAVRHGCAAAVRALAADGDLRTDLTEDAATDLLWVLLSVENWERLVRDCGWTQETYLREITALSHHALLAQSRT